MSKKTYKVVNIARQETLQEFDCEYEFMDYAEQIAEENFVNTKFEEIDDALDYIDSVKNLKVVTN